MQAKKSLGQNFLKSERALMKIVECAELSSQDLVLEIGPGLGTLTARILATGARLVAVEKDDDLYELLQQKFSKEISSGKLILIHDDILHFEISKYVVGKYKLVANIPYNITGAIFRKFLSSPQQPELMVVLVQKEVANRVVAKDKKESVFSISVKSYGNPKLIDKVLAGSFSPRPKVDSAILKINNISKNFFTSGLENREEEFFTLVRAGFQAKRKKLSSNLSQLLSKEHVESAFSTLNLSPNTRAEELDVETWQKLAWELIK